MAAYEMLDEGRHRTQRGELQQRTGARLCRVVHVPQRALGAVQHLAQGVAPAQELRCVCVCVCVVCVYVWCVYVCEGACMRARVRVLVRACVRSCERTCVYACVGKAGRHSPGIAPQAAGPCLLRPVPPPLAID
jgi:hypothetical protein